MAISTILAVAAALMWPAPVSALHDLPCGPFSETVVDPNTGREHCAERSPEARAVLQRSRQLQLEQERRTRALAIRQQRQTGAERRVRELEIQQQQLENTQSLIGTLERARQQQRDRELAVQALQPALSLEQSIIREQGLNGLEADETLRRAQLRANDLKRRQNALRQELLLPAFELESELRIRRRQLEKQPRLP